MMNMRATGKLSTRLRTVTFGAVLIVLNGVLPGGVAQAADLSAHDMALLDRLTWGINASSAAHFQAVGAEHWIQEQLHPPAGSVLPASAQAQIEAMPDVHKSLFDIAIEFDQQGKAANQVADPDQKKTAQQAYQQAMN